MRLFLLFWLLSVLVWATTGWAQTICWPSDSSTTSRFTSPIYRQPISTGRLVPVTKRQPARQTTFVAITRKDYDKLAAEIASLKQLLAKLQRTPGPIGPIGKTGGTGPTGPIGPRGLQGQIGPAAILDTQASHMVLVADTAADYWKSVRSAFDNARQRYHSIRRSDLPEYPIGEVPQLVVYRDGKPIDVFRGKRDVESALRKVSRGKYPPP